MGKCARCGSRIDDKYTYCKSCFYELGSPKGTVASKEHKCKKCGRTIKGKYNYCIQCAKVQFSDNLRWK